MSCRTVFIFSFNRTHSLYYVQFRFALHHRHRTVLAVRKNRMIHLIHTLWSILCEPKWEKCGESDWFIHLCCMYYVCDLDREASMFHVHALFTEQIKSRQMPANHLFIKYVFIMATSFVHPNNFEYFGRLFARTVNCERNLEFWWKQNAQFTSSPIRDKQIDGPIEMFDEWAVD